MSFNPANFPFTMPAIRREQDRGTTEGNTPAMLQAEELHAAACRFEARTDAFAAGKGATCRDMAGKLIKYGSFVSEKQADFARKLVEWSKPRQQAVAAPQALPVAPALPKLFTLMQRLAKLTIGQIQIVRKNGDSLCWIKHEGAEKVVGRITEGGMLTLWTRPGINVATLNDALLAIEKDPEAAAVLHGRASGRCSICNRDLTDPESIERGIGPICAEKF
jgi:hypothetical protein